MKRQTRSVILTDHDARESPTKTIAALTTAAISSSALLLYGTRMHMVAAIAMLALLIALTLVIR